MKPFLDAIDERVLVCDGAMGTMLYAKGVFINRCFDGLNLSDPDRVADVHQDYVRAGADVIETNTFGANRIKLRGFGLADRLREINIEGVGIAKRAARGQVYVAGAIGPLGVRIEPWGRIGIDEAEGYFREQAQALADGGVDLFILETFRDLNEMRAAMAAVRSICALPVVAQMTTEEDGNSLDGTAPEEFAPALEAGGADVIGVNCSVGPAPMLETLERIASVTRARLSAQPNAGRPRDVEGRNLYLSSPDYVASYARRFIAAGVRLVGGCCGTTPEHIRQIRTAVTQQATSPASRADTALPVVVGAASSDVVVPRRERSELARSIVEGRFVTLVELLPPRGFITEDLVAQARTLKLRGVDAVHVPEGARGARMSALALAVLIHQQAGIETTLEYSSRDRNLLGMESDLLGAHAMGVRNVVLVTGDPRAVGDYPHTARVSDVDSIGLTNVVARFNQGRDVGGQGIGRPTAFHVGVQVNPSAEDLDAEIRRFEFKVAAGAEFAVTRPLFDVATFERFHRRIEHAGLPIIVGLWPFESVLSAEYMANEIPGMRVSEDVLDRMRRASDGGGAAAEGVRIARELGAQVKGMVQGLRVAAPSGRIEVALEVLEGIQG